MLLLIAVGQISELVRASQRDSAVVYSTGRSWQGSFILGCGADISSKLFHLNNPGDFQYVFFKRKFDTGLSVRGYQNGHQIVIILPRHG